MLRPQPIDGTMQGLHAPCKGRSDREDCVQLARKVSSSSEYFGYAVATFSKTHVASS